MPKPQRTFNEHLTPNGRRPQPAALAATTRSSTSPKRSNVNMRTTSQESVSRQRNSRANKRKQATPRKLQRQRKLLQEINRLRASTSNQVPKLSFYRLVKEIIMANSRSDIRVTSLAIQALQESAELYLTNLFEDSYRLTMHRQRLTLSVQDIQLVRYLRGRSDPGNA